MHPGDCPAWDYEDHPDHAVVLPPRSRDFLVALRSDVHQHQHLLADLRPIHAIFFAGLTPATCPYFAGHIRGEIFRCLEWYRVRVGADPLVGALPQHVSPLLEALSAKLQQALTQLDAAAVDVERPLSRVHLLSFLVPLAAHCLEVFLTVHPYANGNGHMGRLLVYVLFARYGVWPQVWSIDHRPLYSPLLSEHRRGNVEPLQILLYQAIIGPVSPSGQSTSGR